jgi:hypothetical protein
MIDLVAYQLIFDDTKEVKYQFLILLILDRRL